MTVEEAIKKFTDVELAEFLVAVVACAFKILGLPVGADEAMKQARDVAYKIIKSDASEMGIKEFIEGR